MAIERIILERYNESNFSTTNYWNATEELFDKIIKTEEPHVEYLWLESRGRKYEQRTDFIQGGIQLHYTAKLPTGTHEGYSYCTLVGPEEARQRMLEIKEIVISKVKSKYELLQEELKQ